jgi:hypothetical protein
LKFCEMQLHLVASAAPTRTDNPDRAAQPSGLLLLVSARLIP